MAEDGGGGREGGSLPLKTSFSIEDSPPGEDGHEELSLFSAAWDRHLATKLRVNVNSAASLN